MAYVVRDRVSVAAALLFVKLERAVTVVEAVTGVDERVDPAGGNADFGTPSGSSRVGGELLVVEERRDSVISAVALLVCERVKVDDTTAATIWGKKVR